MDMREEFEADAAAMGFELTRHECAAPEPWSEYKDSNTGHRWGGYQAAYSAGQRAERERIANALRRGGATLPAPEVTGTIQGSIITGLCVALCVVEAES